MSKLISLRLTLRKKEHLGNISLEKQLQPTPPVSIESERGTPSIVRIDE